MKKEERKVLGIKADYIYISDKFKLDCKSIMSSNQAQEYIITRISLY